MSSHDLFACPTNYVTVAHLLLDRPNARCFKVTDSRDFIYNEDHFIFKYVMIQRLTHGAAVNHILKCLKCPTMN